MRLGAREFFGESCLEAGEGQTRKANVVAANEVEALINIIIINDNIVLIILIFCGQRVGGPY